MDGRDRGGEIPAAVESLQAGGGCDRDAEWHAGAERDRAILAGLKSRIDAGEMADVGGGWRLVPPGWREAGA